MSRFVCFFFACRREQKNDPKVRFAETRDVELMARRVAAFVTEGSGLWSSTIEDKYAAQFAERLPANWIDILPPHVKQLTFHQVLVLWVPFTLTVHPG